MTHREKKLKAIAIAVAHHLEAENIQPIPDKGWSDHGRRTMMRNRLTLQRRSKV